MHPDNRLYGHDEILRAAAGTGGDRPIRAHLQHGWAIGSGLSHPRRLVSWLPRLVWSTENLRAARDQGMNHVHAIGAPFAYLANDDPSPAPTLDAIAYPHHGWRRESVAGDHAELAEAILERDGPSTTICLYWREHDDPAVRTVYERAGFRVVSHGRADNPSFLHNQLAELRKHRRLITNRVGTAVWYGASLGLDVEVYGPMFVVQETPAEAIQFDDLQRRTWPGLFKGGLEGASARDIGATQLGFDRVRSPDQLRELLGLHHPPRYDRVLTLGVKGEHLVRAAAARCVERVRPATPPYAGGALASGATRSDQRACTEAERNDEP